MKMYRVLVLSFVMLFTACASLPTPEKMRAEIADFQLPALPEDGKAMIYVVRPDSLGGLIRFNVFVDDKEPESEMGYTRGSQYIYFNVLPGDHQILSKAENWAEVNLTAQPGDILFIQQSASPGILFARNNVAKIEGYQGKYFVKKLSIGTIKKMDK